MIAGATARGTLAADKTGQPGPIGLPHGAGQARWAAANLDGLLDGMSRMEFVLRFTLSHPGLSSTIVGTANPEHLRANLAVAGRGPLPGDLYAEALRRLPAPAGR